MSKRKPISSSSSSSSSKISSYFSSKVARFQNDSDVSGEKQEVHGVLFRNDVTIRFDPAKDGNCQFSAVCDQLSLHPSIGRLPSVEGLRQQVADHISMNPYSLEGSHLKNFVFPITDWNTYLMKLKCNGTFGDSITLFAIAMLYKVQIVVLSTLGPEGTRVFLPTGDSFETFDPLLPVILLGHVEEGKGDHYVSIAANDTNVVINIVNEAFNAGHVSEMCSKVNKLNEGCTESVFSHCNIAAQNSLSKTEVNASKQQQECAEVNASKQQQECAVVNASKQQQECVVQAVQPAMHRSCGSNIVPSHSQPEIIHDAATSDKELHPDIPNVWTLNQYLEKRREYPWLYAENNKLGCSICKSVTTLGVEKCQGARISTEWASGTVGAYGNDREKQLVSLRKKIHDHKKSLAHLKSQKIVNSKHANVLPAVQVRNMKSQYDTTSRVFRTAYNIAKNGRPFTDLSSEVELQTVNGLDMGRTLHSRTSCTNIIEHISDAMHTNLLTNIIRTKHKFSIMIDESTTVSRKTTLIIYMRSCIDDAAEPITYFLDLIELDRTTAQCIADALFSCLFRYGMSMDILKECWVCCATDGASVMLGKNSGVCSILRDKLPHIVLWHCSNHRLELAVHDTIAEVTGINLFQIFFDKLYSLYHASPKNQRELQEACEALHIQCLAIGRMLSTRWVASSLRTVRAVWVGYTAIVKHLEVAAVDTLRDARERSQYSGLHKKLTSVQFVSNLGIMYDALTELADVSLMLQRKDMTLPNAHNILSRQVRVFSSMIDTAGPFALEARTAANNKEFQGVKLSIGSKAEVEIQHGQFFASLANNIRKRMLTTRSSGRSSSEDVLGYEKEYENLLKSLSCLIPETWPTDIDTNVRYGESEVTHLCQRFSLPTRQCIQGFREYKDNGGKRLPHDLLPLKKTIDSLVVSTADCERGFSQMNTIMCNTRASLTVKHLSKLMFIKCVGPPLQKFNPLPYVKTWLVKGHVTSDDTKARACNAFDMATAGSAKVENDVLWSVL